MDMITGQPDLDNSSTEQVTSSFQVTLDFAKLTVNLPALGLNVKWPPQECRFEHRIVHLNTWLRGNGAVWEGCGVFREQSLPGGNRLKQTDLEV